MAHSHRQQQQLTHLHTLPTELLTQIITLIPTLPSLSAFLTAYPPFTPILTSTLHPEILTAVLSTQSPPLQLQKLVAAIMALGDHPPPSLHPIQSALFYYIIGNNEPLQMPYFQNPLKTLRYIAGISESIEIYTASFAIRRISLPSIKPLYTISPTEWYRIQRAFWRFQLCYELAHAAPSAGTTPTKKDRSSKVPDRWQRRYFQHRRYYPGTLLMPNWVQNRGLPPGALLTDYLNTLTDWEIEELDAARFHVRAEVNRFQYHRVAGAEAGEDLRGQDLLLQRLVRDLDYWNEDPDLPTDHFLVVDFLHPAIEAAHRVSTVWTDIPSPANEPNITRGPDYTMTWQLAQIIAYQDYEPWGWSMWDSARASKRGILARPPMLARNNHTDMWGRVEDDWKRVRTANHGCYEDQFDEVDGAIEVSFQSDLRRKMWEDQVERVKNMSGWDVGNLEFGEGIAGLVWVGK